MPQYHDQISAALDMLTEGLRPYVEQKLQATYRDQLAPDRPRASFRDGRDRSTDDGEGLDWDAHSLLTVMWDQWNAVFRNDLGHTERSLVSELREFRNRWAHQQEFDFDDAYRVLDSVRRLLKADRRTQCLPWSTSASRKCSNNTSPRRLTAQLQQTVFNRTKWWVIGIYSLCCAAITYHMITSGRSGSNGSGVDS